MKIKIKQLASEAKDIRNEERRSTKQTRRSLYLHRVNDIRPYARLNYLAYGFLRGRSYQQLERDARIKPNWKEVEKLVKRFGVIRDVENGETQHEFKERQTEQRDRWLAWVCA